MNVEKFLYEKKSTILKKWLDQILDTYPDDAKRFLKEQKDPFANPVGNTISREIQHLYDEFLKGIDPEKMSPILDRIIRIRAIQDFSPSQAVSFIFILKGIAALPVAEKKSRKPKALYLKVCPRWLLQI